MTLQFAACSHKWLQGQSLRSKDLRWTVRTVKAVEFPRKKTEGGRGADFRPRIMGRLDCRLGRWFPAQEAGGEIAKVLGEIS